MIKIFLTLITFLFISAGAVVHAQSASIVTGRIIDAQRAPVTGAAVTITNAATNASQTATSNADGVFVFPQLSPATYRIEVSAVGFQLASQNNVIVSVAGTTTQNFQLEVAGPDEVITIAGQPDIIERDSGVVGTVIDRNFVENLPLNGRSFQTLIELTPGVVLTPAQVTSPGQFSVNGQRTNSNYFMLDGVGANSGTTPIATSSQQAAGTLPNTTVVGGFNNLASVDELQEFRVLTSSFAPEFGRTPGGQIALVTRSGTNRYSGSVYNYLRNEIFDANTFFNNRAGIPRGKLRQNNFGFTFAGPLPFLNFGEGGPFFSSGRDRTFFSSGRDRTFFFLSYEGSRVRRT
ncbi:MAG: carboxypeptidase regulatory-like domain-containing protein [Blastocatellia bacterium]|nr:carboxypeptidase regulatory-like domain-containing protein [Blastocatellia bacterium]